MRVRVLFFGMLKELMGRDVDALELPEAAVLNDVLRFYAERNPRLQAVTPSLAMSINQEYATPQARLKSGDEIALLPPVSGGLAEVAPSNPVVQLKSFATITRNAIDSRKLVERLKQPEDGAAVLFEGIVRNHSRGRRTLFLDYEAYEEMAVKQMDELARQALSKFSIRDVAIVHRIGKLEIGETSVAIAVASAHRGAAFDACRWIIDTLKRTVPIWKKEHFADGAIWADGEPFPPEVSGKGSHSEETASK